MSPPVGGVTRPRPPRADRPGHRARPTGVNRSRVPQDEKPRPGAPGRAGLTASGAAAAVVQSPPPLPHAEHPASKITVARETGILRVTACSTSV